MEKVVDKHWRCLNLSYKVSDGHPPRTSCVAARCGSQYAHARVRHALFPACNPPPSPAHGAPHFIWSRWWRWILIVWRRCWIRMKLRWESRRRPQGHVTRYGLPGSSD